MSHHIAILLLAAGGSSRFGSPKQLHGYKGKPLVRHLAEAATRSKASETLVILGASAEKIQPALDELPVTIIRNDRWREGISTSIHAGISTLAQNTDAVLIMLCDQPLVTPEILNSIIGTYLTNKKAIITSEYSGTLGVPALFAASLFPELLKLHGNRGAKQIMNKYPKNISTIPFPGGAVDIDHPGDVQLIS